LRDIEDRSNPQGHGLLDVWMSHGDKVTRCRRASSRSREPGLRDGGMAD
jgi:GMP synthase (glutamine-hydrolysing)